MEIDRSPSWGHLKDDTPFAAIFPDGRVPLASIWPIIPREAGAPRCYVVDAAQCSDAQIEALAALLLVQWGSECASLDEARAYIRNGLPLRCTHFTSVGTTRSGIAHMVLGMLEQERIAKSEES